MSIHNGPARRLAILAYIGRHQAEHGFAPSVRELTAAVGLASTSATHSHLVTLRYAGLVDYEPLFARSLHLTQEGVAMSSLSLWDTMTPPTTADPMSAEAAASMVGPAKPLRLRVLEAILRREPVAEWELEEQLGMPGNTLRPRLWELTRAGLVARGAGGTTPAGRACYLYGTTILGRETVGS